MEMVRLGFDIATGLLSIGAFFIWYNDFRHSYLRFLAIPLPVVGSIILFADSSVMFMLVTFVISLGLIVWYQKSGALDRLFKDLKAEKEAGQLEVVDNQKGEIRGKLGRVEFDYYDRDGDKTRRIVDVDRVYYEAGNGYFDGFCNARKARRTFRMDRVAGSVVDHETGEVVDL